ncbi:MAG TPA: PilZ domain-containing protein [Rhodopseudomonas sp.]|uniref:PilZ domain-containing protein n=1 Tax=Rhodopseudomonas sp. TaxID=1078 RepID=UPI002ED8123F
MASTKKRDSRKAVQQTGWITLEGGFAARPCVVLDLSASGAKITLESPQALNSKLRLAFSRDARHGRDCEVVWRRGSTLGLKFTA